MHTLLIPEKKKKRKNRKTTFLLHPFADSSSKAKRNGWNRAKMGVRKVRQKIGMVPPIISAKEGETFFRVMEGRTIKKLGAIWRGKKRTNDCTCSIFFVRLFLEIGLMAANVAVHKKWKDREEGKGRFLTAATAHCPLYLLLEGWKRRPFLLFILREREESEQRKREY